MVNALLLKALFLAPPPNQTHIQIQNLFWPNKKMAENTQIASSKKDPK